MVNLSIGQAAKTVGDEGVRAIKDTHWELLAHRVYLRKLANLQLMA
jgi:hypothetical protein